MIKNIYDDNSDDDDDDDNDDDYQYMELFQFWGLS